VGRFSSVSHCWELSQTSQCDILSGFLRVIADSIDIPIILWYIMPSSRSSVTPVQSGGYAERYSEQSVQKRCNCVHGW